VGAGRSGTPKVGHKNAGEGRGEYCALLKIHDVEIEFCSTRFVTTKNH
jgi:hypothetical protein